MIEYSLNNIVESIDNLEFTIYKKDLQYLTCNLILKLYNSKSVSQLEEIDYYLKNAIKKLKEKLEKEKTGE